jgi:hypothetical protein
MKKAILSIVGVVIVAWVALSAYSVVKMNRAAAAPWPASLGTIDDVPARFTAAEQSASATRLVQLAAAANIDLKPRERNAPPRTAARPDPMRATVGDYVRKQLERSSDAIDAPPAAVAQRLAKDDAAISAVRNQLLSGPPIVWETKIGLGFDAPIPNLLGQMHLQKMFMARAFDKAQRNDPAAWEELHASWELNRGLWRRPDLISSLIALAATRMSMAAARKMPLPAPAWFDEELAFDHLAALAASQQAESYSMRKLASPVKGIRGFVMSPIFRYESADVLEMMRAFASEVFRSRACDASGPLLATARASLVSEYPAMPNLVSIWDRALRFTAEREGTERVLQLRAGKIPAPKSACLDGLWFPTANGIRFSREIPVSRNSIRYPLGYVR